MKRRNATRNALFTSIISLLLCVSMLVGTTFAWFTDSVQSGMNNIVAGNLDIELEYSKDASAWKTVSSATDLFSGALWEPGHTEVVYLKLSNKGTLALNYQLGINIASETAGTNVAGQSFKLSDYIEFGVVEGQSTKFADRAAAVAAVTDSKKLNEGYSKASSMVPGAADAYMALVVYMPETVGNEANYRGTAVPTIQLGVNVLATQKTHESDSFDNQYDALAQGGSTSDAAPTAGYKEYTVYSGDSNVKAATMQIHSNSVEDANLPIEISIVPTALNTNIAVSGDQKAATYEITVKNLKEGNTTPIKVELNVGTGLTGVEVYHNDTKITSSYNATTGYVIFETNSFSPYTVVRDAVATEDEPTDTGLPTATVTEDPASVGTEIAWGTSFGNAQAEQQLEAAYIFKTPHTSENIKDSKYKDWLCDFYVSVDRDVPEGAIFLGGNYGDFGWLGFDNTGLPVTANQEIPLLGTAISGSTDGTTNWTYESIVNLVAEFKCGVARTYNTDMKTLEGATFTVKLCLINPDTNERTAVNTVNYTFEEIETIDTQEEMSAAIVAGGTVKLEAGQYTMPSSSTSSSVKIVGTKDVVIDVTKGAYMDNANVSIEGVTIKTSTGYVQDANGNQGSDYAALYTPNVTYTNCVFEGPMRVGRDGAKFINCTFNIGTGDYIWTYGNDVTFEGCTFNTQGKAILIYSDGGNEVSQVSVKNCTFNSTTGAKAGAIANQNCAAIEIHNYGNGVNLTTSGNTYDSNFSGEWRIKTYETGRTSITVNGAVYTTIALDGKLMTIDANKNVNFAE